jgi:hypothetical protein
MPIHIELANLILPKRRIMEKYQGGIAQFRQDYHVCGDNKHQEDDELISLSAMNCDEFHIQEMVDRGLQFDPVTNSSDDFVILARYGGRLWDMKWLRDNAIFAWHRDCDSQLLPPPY